MSANIYFDPTSGRIFSNGIEVGRLNYSERLVFEILIKEKNKIVAKDDLLAAGWPGRVVVSNSLNIAIKSIREALERAGVHSEPETIPKMGYKLSIDITFINSELDIQQLGLIHSKNDPNSSYAEKCNEKATVKKDYGEKKKSQFTESILRQTYYFFYKKTYYFYVATVLLISTSLYLARIMSEPEIYCVEYEKSRFCGAHIINENDIPAKFLNGNAEGDYWFTERDDEFTFFKVN